MRSSMPRWIALALMTSLTAGCDRAVSSAACPPLVSYSPAEQAQAADELRTLPAGAMLREFIKDYGVLRAQVRACR